MRTYKLYASTAASSDNLASILIARNARIKSVRWAVSLDQVADNSVANIELSTRQTNQLTTNESQGDIGALRCHANLVTSGLSQGSFNKQELLDFPVAAGERIYLHATITTTTAVITVFLDMEER